MNIAHVVSTFSPQLGGMGKVCLDEALGLAKRGHAVTVFTVQYDRQDYTAHDAQFPFPIVRLKPYIKMGDAGWVPQLHSVLKKNFDIVHVHYPFYGGIEWLLGVRMPLVITYHMDAQLAGLKSLIARVYDMFWPKWLFAKAKKIIIVDANSADKKIAIDASKMIALANGVDINIFKPCVVGAEQIGLPNIKNKKVILFTGNLLSVKRLDLLLEAFWQLADMEAVLLVVGGGSQLFVYQQMAVRMKIDHAVYFVGVCADAKTLAQYYNLADCVVVPSDYESFSLVAIEAMACGKPLVLSNIPGLATKTSSAIFFEKGSVVSLVNALRMALNVSSAAKQHIATVEIAEVKQKYSLQNHIECLEQVYQDVISSK